MICNQLWMIILWWYLEYVPHICLHWKHGVSWWAIPLMSLFTILALESREHNRTTRSPRSRVFCWRHASVAVSQRVPPRNTLSGLCRLIISYLKEKCSFCQKCFIFHLSLQKRIFFFPQGVLIPVPIVWDFFKEFSRYLFMLDVTTRCGRVGTCWNDSVRDTLNWEAKGTCRASMVGRNWLENMCKVASPLYMKQ